MTGEPRRQTHVADMAIAHGADERAAIMAAYIATHRLLVEVLEQVGGEVTLPAGFNDRLVDDSLSAVTSPTDDGGTLVTLIPTPAEYRMGTSQGAGVAPGMFWRRHRDEDHAGVRYRVERVDMFENVELTPMSGGLALEVKAATLLEGADGWRRAEA